MEGYNLAVREGLRNFRRARTLSLAMAGCVAVAVFAMGAFAFLVLNVNSLLKKWESRVELVAFLSRGPEAQSPQKVLDDVRSINEVGDARLVSGQQSWEELFSEAGDSLDLGEVPLDEVLPPSIVIRLVEGNRDLSVIRRVASRVASIKGVDEVRFEETMLERYLQFRREMAGFAAGTSIFWILAFGIITVNIARLASTARKSEIRTLRMLGASTKFIRRVFAVEGVAQGMCGSAVGVGALAVTAALLSNRMGETLRLPLGLVGAAFAVGPALALMASWFSLRNVLVVTLAVLLAAWPAGSLVRADEDLESELVKYQQELKRLERDLQQSMAAAEKLGQQERAIIDDLEGRDKEIDSLAREIKTGEANIAANKEAIGMAQAELGRCETLYVRSRQELEQWLRLLCNQREPSLVEVILCDIPQSEITRRRRMLSLLAEKEAETFERAEGLRRTYLEQQETLRKRVELDTLYTEAAKLRAQQAVEKKRQREVILTKLREQKNIYLAAITDLEASARNLQDFIEKQRAEAQPALTGAVPFGEMRGLLPWPTEGEITVPFGRVRNPDSGTFTRHLGVDISGSVGSQIRAIHDAIVAYCDWFRGYGKLVILDHGDGYNSIYSHCSEILVRKGDHVKGGQPIALVGETGSLKGPFLYFEIREHGDPVDPAVWLQRRNIHATQSE